MISEAEIRRRVSGYLEGRTKLRDLNSWLVSYSWDMHADGSSEAAQELVSDIELALAEFSNSDCDEAELRKLLAPLAGGLIARQPIQITTALPASFSRQQVAWPT